MSLSSEKTATRRIQFCPTGSKKQYAIQIPRHIWDKMVATKKKVDLTAFAPWFTCLQGLDQKLALNDIEFLERLLRIGRENGFLGTGAKRRTIASALAPSGLNSCADLLWLFQFDLFRDLTKVASKTLLTNACKQAISQNDLQFFVKLGRRLTEKPQPTMAMIARKPGDRLRHLIAAYWMDFSNDGPHFCFFSDAALSQFIKLICEDIKPTPEAVKITRKRLRLRHPIKPLIHDAILKGSEILLQ